MSVRVECYSGVEYAERPNTIYWDGERLEVVAILGRWRTPNGKRFRVRTRDGQILELTYDEIQDRWTILTEKEIS